MVLSQLNCKNRNRAGARNSVFECFIFSSKHFVVRNWKRITKVHWLLCVFVWNVPMCVESCIKQTSQCVRLTHTCGHQIWFLIHFPVSSVLPPHLHVFLLSSLILCHCPLSPLLIRIKHKSTHYPCSLDVMWEFFRAWPSRCNNFRPTHSKSI